jgi:hypothetical protein
MHPGTCLASGVDYRFKCVTLGIRKVQLGRVKCVHANPLQREGDGVSVCHSLNLSKLDITQGILDKGM